MTIRNFYRVILNKYLGVILKIQFNFTFFCVEKKKKMFIFNMNVLQEKIKFYYISKLVIFFNMIIG